MYDVAVRTIARVALCMSIFGASLPALSIKEFRRYSIEDQAVFVSGAVSMVAYDLAVRGEVPRAKCVRAWYFGSAGKAATGPSDLAVELNIAERQDAEKLHVEGVILGTIGRACKADR